MKGNQRFGAEAQKVTWAGIAYRRGTNDGLGNGCWLGQMPAGVEPAQSGSSTEA